VALADLWAGAEVQLAGLLAQLYRRPELSLSMIVFNEGRLKKEIESLGIPVTVFPETKWGSARIFINLVRKLREANVHIVHTHKHKDTILAALAARLSNRPYVVRTVHGLPEPFTGFAKTKMRAYEAVERIVHQRCVDCIIGVSLQIADQYKAESGIPRVTCIHNGIDLAAVVGHTDRRRVREDLGVGPGETLIGTIGRLVPVKGISYLLEAAKVLLQEGEDVKVLVVGEGPIRKELEAQARDLTIDRNVVFLGHREDVHQLIQTLDIFVLPSLSEGIPMALLEAMAASRPVVATRVGGIPEVIEHGREGFLVEPKDAKGIAEGCRRLIRAPDVASRMGEQGHERVKREYSAATVAERVVSLYRELVMGRCLQ
jgi:glycosyltransferase involved in cell wall biosynthesis